MNLPARLHGHPSQAALAPILDRIGTRNNVAFMNNSFTRYQGPGIAADDCSITNLWVIANNVVSGDCAPKWLGDQSQVIAAIGDA